MANPDPLKLVLVIDDDAAHAYAYARALESRGLHAMTASNTASAVKMARELQPVAVLVDMRMPRMSGAETIKRLRSETDLAVICVGISVSAEALEAAQGCDLKILKTESPARDLGPFFDLLRIGRREPRSRR